MKTFTSVADIGSLTEAIAEARAIKADRFAYASLGRNRTLMMVFFNSEPPHPPVDTEGGAQSWHERHSARHKPGRMEA